MKTLFNITVLLAPYVLFFTPLHSPNFMRLFLGIILSVVSLYLIFSDKKSFSYLFFGFSEVVFVSAFTNFHFSVFFSSSYVLLIILFKIWESNLNVIKDEFYKISFMQNNPEEVAQTMFKQLEKKLGKSYVELSYMEFLYTNGDFKDYEPIKDNAVKFPIKIFDKDVGYLKVIPLKKLGPIKSAFVKQTLDITTYWLMNVIFLNSVTLLESLENFASRNDYGIIVENNGSFLYTNKYVQKNFPYIHNLQDLVDTISDKYKGNFRKILENEGNDIFVLENNGIDLFVGIGIEKSNRSIGDLNIIKISSITSSNINEILLYKFDTMKFRELVTSLYVISTIEDKDKAFDQIIDITKSKISTCKNIFIFIKQDDTFKLKASDIKDDMDISIDASEIPDVIGPWFTENLTLKSKGMQQYLNDSSAILTKFTDGENLEGLLILTLNETSTIDKLDISIINIIVQYINIALINIITIHKLSLVAKHDDLTGLLRRESFYELFEHILELSKRTDKVFSLVYIDMDGLKFINDNYGHNYGDEALKILSNTLKSSMRASDISARLGGDEFAVLLNDTSDPEKFVKRVKDSLEKKLIPEINLKISVSFGYYVYDGEQTNIKEIIEIADKRMYEDKRKKKYYEDRN